MNHYLKLISIKTLFQAWEEFRKGKRKRLEVQIFERHLGDNLFNLHQALRAKSYQHGSYASFYVQDPKQRHIHKASVQDQIVHHLLYKFLYELFDKSFIYDSYSCRLNKGTHKGVLRLEKFARKVSKNYTSSCWALKMDIKKFFASVDHSILLSLLKKKISDENILWLLSKVINSFHSEDRDGKGIPLGNLTSQVFANIYLNELDQFVKHKLKVRSYIRYADDFLLLSNNKEYLHNLIGLIKTFLQDKLRLEFHPNKITSRKLEWGIDFLGYIVLPYCRLPRTKTKRRILRKVRSLKISDQSLASYLGYLSHADAFKVEQELKNLVWLVSIDNLELLT